MTTLDTRVLGPSALVAGLSPLVGNGLYAGPTGSGTALLRDLAEPLPAGAALGLALELVGLVAIVVFLAALVAILARRTPIAASGTGIAGAAMVAVKLGSVTPVLALRADPEGVPPEVAEVLIGVNDASFVVAGLLLSLSLAIAGIGLQRSGPVPGWLAWWPVLAGGLGVLAAGAGVLLPDGYVPVPFLLLLLWMMVLGAWSIVGGSARTVRGAAVATPQ
ncbi:MAG TPA: DUF4386 family protein [Marmoricola sp.]|nr:DUF4386 family protein [Marmoricola sp.]